LINEPGAKEYMTHLNGDSNPGFINTRFDVKKDSYCSI